MHDYKFRHNELFSDKPKRTWYKALLLPIGLALAVGVLYGIIHLVGLIGQKGSEEPETDRDIIPLALPPYTQPQDR